MNDRPRQRKYARVERERRFLLVRLPELVDADNYERLHDLYLANSNLRLRRIEHPSGELIIVKLGQKLAVPGDSANHRHRQMTTLYLAPHEESLFASLPGKRSVKRRYRLQEQGWTFAIDVYERPAAVAGTIIAEVECDSDEELDRIVVPTWARREITADPQWLGASLARSS